MRYVAASLVTDRQTDKQNDYCHPPGACAPRVNEALIKEIKVIAVT